MRWGAKRSESGGASGVFHKITEAQQQDGHQDQGCKDEQSRLQQKHAQDAAVAGTVHLVYAHRLGPVTERRDGDKHIVECDDKQDGQAHRHHDAVHQAHIVLRAVSVAQRLQDGHVFKL